MNRYYGVRLYPWVLLDHPNDENSYDGYLYHEVQLPKIGKWEKIASTRLLHPVEDLVDSGDYPYASIVDTIVNIVELRINGYSEPVKFGITRFGLLIVEFHQDKIRLEDQRDLAYQLLRDMVSILSLDNHWLVPRPEDLVKFKYFNYPKVQNSLNGDEIENSRVMRIAIELVDQRNQMEVGGFCASPNTQGELGYYFTFDYIKSITVYRASKSEFLITKLKRIENIDELYKLLIQLYQNSKEAFDTTAYRNAALTAWTGIEVLLHHIETRRRQSLAFLPNEISIKYNISKMLDSSIHTRSNSTWLSAELKHAMRSLYGYRGRIAHTVHTVHKENTYMMVSVLRWFILMKITNNPDSMFVKNVKEFQPEPNGEWIHDLTRGNPFTFWIDKNYDASLDPVT